MLQNVKSFIFRHKKAISVVDGLGLSSLNLAESGVSMIGDYYKGIRGVFGAEYFEY